jgi:hypothetical protein
VGDERIRRAPIAERAKVKDIKMVLPRTVPLSCLRREYFASGGESPLSQAFERATKDFHA